MRLTAVHRSGRVVIEIADDGAGINRKKVREIAVEKGLISPNGNDEGRGHPAPALFIFRTEHLIKQELRARAYGSMSPSDLTSRFCR